MAYVTGVVLAFMTVVGLPYKYLMGQSATWYSVGWVGHGWLYVLYVLAAIDLATRCRWGFVRSVLDALAARQISLAKASSYLDGLKIADLHKLERHCAGA